jgi:hypothetical protein
MVLTGCWGKTSFFGLTMTTKISLILAGSSIVAVGLIAIFALTRYHCNCTESAEKEMLKEIFFAQRTFHQTHGRFADIGSTLRAGDVAPELQLEIASSFRYILTIDADSTGYICTATGNLDDDTTLDILAVDATGHLWIVSDDIIR